MHTRTKRTIALAVRGIFLLGIIIFAILGDWGSVVANLIIFGGSLFVFWLGKKDDQFYLLDAACMGVFLLALPTFLDWAIPTSLPQQIFGIDKLFHMAGGACLALFAAILLRRRTKGQLTFYIGILVFALALGAAWEIFEWLISLLPAPFTVPSSGYADSMLDLVADLLGASVAAVVLKLRGFV